MARRFLFIVALTVLPCCIKARSIERVDSLAPDRRIEFVFGLSALDLLQYRAPDFKEDYFGAFSLSYGLDIPVGNQHTIAFHSSVIMESPFGEYYDRNWGAVNALKIPVSLRLQQPIGTQRLVTGLGLQASYNQIRKDSIYSYTDPTAPVVDDYADHRWLAGATVSLHYRVGARWGLGVYYFTDLIDLRSRRFIFAQSFTLGFIFWPRY